MSDLTKKNLKEAFAGESQANRLYIAFARAAAEEGFPNIARLFRTIAEAETIHAHSILRALGGIGNTLKNLEGALKGETDEISGMYPMFMDQAKRDADNEALKAFFWTYEAEKTHAHLYEKALAAAKKGEDADFKDLYICEVCGYTVEGPPPEKCYTCGEGKDKFKRFE